MNDLTNAQKQNEVIAQNHALNAHEFLLKFLSKFDTAKRGGIHDFMEISLFNMINLAVGKVDAYLSQGHTDISANEIMAIITESYQIVVDNLKRSLDNLRQVNMR